MDDIVKLVSEKTGIPESAAEQAVKLVLGELKKKLPEPLGGQLEGILNGNVDAGDLLGSMSGGGGGIIGMLKSLIGGK